MSCRSYLRRLALGAFTLTAMVGAATSGSPTATASSRPLSVRFERSPCAVADDLMHQGLLARAEAQYESLLARPTTQGGPPQCTVAGLEQVVLARDRAARLAALGDRALADGQPVAARSYYEAALAKDHDNQEAATGLQTLDRQRPNNIRQFRDHWSQVVANTLVPLGELFLLILAVGMAGYILFLLTRVGARLPLPELPSHSLLRTAGAAVLTLGALAGIAAAVTGVTRLPRGQAGRVWPWLLSAAGILLVLGCLLRAWWLRSRIGLQLEVHDKTGTADQVASAYLADRLDALAADPPCGFELPQQTDVTALSGEAISFLPGGGMLAALVSLLRASVPVTPWQATVNLIDDDQLLVITRRNARLTGTVLANRAGLFFPDAGSKSDSSNTASYVKTIDRSGMLTVAAAIILVEMARKHRELRQGLTGATRWESVAGQVLATDSGLSGKQPLDQAMLAHAIDVDPMNLTARVAQTVGDGRRAEDPRKRRAFAERISEIAGLTNLLV